MTETEAARALRKSDPVWHRLTRSVTISATIPIRLTIEYSDEEDGWLWDCTLISCTYGTFEHDRDSAIHAAERHIEDDHGAAAIEVTDD